MERDTRQTVKEAALEYAANDMAIGLYQRSQLYKSFVAGAEWERQKAINAHLRSCPNLSKDNDWMCNHSFDCDQNCEYMKSFISLLGK